jgi:hypothetical protein
MSSLKVQLALLIILLLQVTYRPSHACTSFVIYSTKTWYGMNFDWPDANLKFCIQKSGAIKYFDFQFLKSNYYSTTAGMNEQGVFSSIQMLYPEVTRWTAGTTLWDAFLYALSSQDSLGIYIDQLEQNSTNIRHINGTTLHNLFADKYGNAFVLEVGNNKNLLTRPVDGMLVMANFPNHQFAGQNYTSVYGAGADRYKAAYQYLLEHKTDFSLPDAFETLKRSVQPMSAEYPTQCSMVFDPEEKNIYLVIRQLFDKIWKLSLTDESIETYSGFDTSEHIDIGTHGIPHTLLEMLTSVNDQNEVHPHQLGLLQNYPNPFNPSTTIRYTLREAASVSLKIYNINGKELTTLVQENRPGGEHHIVWHADGFPSGIYLARLLTGTQTKAIKMLIQK